jgi:hypothetical protein
MGDISIQELKDFAQIIGPIVAAGALVLALWSYRQRLRLDHYTEIDKIYADLVKLRITHTGLAIPRPNPPVDVKQWSPEDHQYDAYALLMWNFIETIYDRFYDRRIKDKRLLRTWQPILKLEGNLHSKWLSKNLDKFKPDFRKWACLTMPEVGKVIDEDGNPRPTADT